MEIDIAPLPYQFLMERAALSWSALLWGYERHHITWPDIVKIAGDRSRLTADLALHDLAAVEKSQVFRVRELLEALSSSEGQHDDSASQKTWLRLLLAWVYHNREHIEDPLDALEKIYADFHYPDEMVPFVRSMPASPDFDVRAHTKEECIDRLYLKWKEYVL